MNIDDKKSFQSFTNHLIDDFQDYLPFTPLCKLHVIDCYLQDMTSGCAESPAGTTDPQKIQMQKR